MPAHVPGAPLGGARAAGGRAAGDAPRRCRRSSSSPTASASRWCRAPAAPGLDGRRRATARAASWSTSSGWTEMFEIDLAERTVTVGPGINMLKLNEVLRPHGVMYPDNPASYSCSLVGGRIGTNGWSLLGSRFGHVRQLVISFEIVLPTGEIIRVGEGGGVKTRSSSSGYRLKELFMGAAGHARHRHAGDARAGQAPGGGVLGVLDATLVRRGLADGRRADAFGLRDHRRRDAVRRAQGRLPAPRRRGVHPAARLGDGRGGVRAVRQQGGGAAGAPRR